MGVCVFEKRIEKLEIRSQGSSFLYYFGGAIIRREGLCHVGPQRSSASHSLNPTVAAIALYESNNPTAGSYAVNRAKATNFVARSYQIAPSLPNRLENAGRVSGRTIAYSPVLRRIWAPKVSFL